MTYKEELERARKLNINILALDVANEVDSINDKENLSNEDFEKICSIVERYYKKTDDIPIVDIVNAIFDLIDSGKTIDEIVNITTNFSLFS